MNTLNRIPTEAPNCVHSVHSVQPSEDSLFDSGDAPGAEPNPNESKNLPPGNGNQRQGVPFIITGDMRQQLYDMRYTREEVDGMTPQRCWEILEENAHYL